MKRVFLILTIFCSNIFSSTIVIVLVIIAAISGFFFLLLKLVQKGVLARLFIDLWPFVLKSWYGILEFISVLSKRIEAIVF